VPVSVTKTDDTVGIFTLGCGILDNFVSRVCNAKRGGSRL